MASIARNLMAGMSAREKKMAVGLVVVLFAFAVFLAVFFVSSAISDLAEESAANRAILELVKTKGPEYLANQRARAKGQVKAVSKPTPLRTLVDAVVKKIDVPDPDTKELSDQHRSDTWVEHGVEVTIRQLGLEKLTKFMEEVEANRRKFPIAITKLDIRKRKRAQDEFDVTMTISTYEKEEGGADDSGQKGAKTARKGGR
jgi:type II secretory pathway component PulM